jgi:hypothetical protein
MWDLGTYNYADGKEYSGDWFANNRHGIGKCRWANGNEYNGEWKDDMRCGHGNN